MPTYAYRCAGCGEYVEYFQSMKEGPKRKCPACGKLKLERQIGTGGGLIFKGGGFYQTDYRSESYTKGAAAEKSASEPTSKESGSSSGGSSSGGGESKGDATSKS